jgi:hypothetical protein
LRFLDGSVEDFLANTPLVKERAGIREGTGTVDATAPPPYSAASTSARDDGCESDLSSRSARYPEAIATRGAGGERALSRKVHAIRSAPPQTPHQQQQQEQEQEQQQAQQHHEGMGMSYPRAEAHSTVGGNGVEGTCFIQTFETIYFKLVILHVFIFVFSINR